MTEHYYERVNMLMNSYFQQFIMINNNDNPERYKYLSPRGALATYNSESSTLWTGIDKAIYTLAERVHNAGQANPP